MVSLGSQMIRHCPHCQKRFGRREETIVEEREAMTLLHFDCSRCQHAFMAVVRATSFGLGAVAVPTDLNVADIARVRRHGVITEDDLLHFHQAIMV